ncbi:nucleoside phosphorylase [Nemorincola caseinilytica]|uniref:Uridine phosphorylase n=1 Tax=Nemorincola caseinilytica TaxID=2054315 RepID=A0ABP8NNB6_9BACT
MSGRHIEPSELIITERGTIYHIDIAPEHLAPTVITVGSPDRVKEVSKYFDKIEHRAQHREFITHTGYVANRRISVISTGIGVGNIDIVLNEIDALMNIDLATRTINEHKTSLSIIRLGTCGTLQADVPVDSMIVSTYAMGLDNLMLFYDMEVNAAQQELLAAFAQHIATTGKNIHPYICEGAAELRSHFTDGYVHGITVTCPGFYGPQGRTLRLQPAFPHILDALASFGHKGHRVANFEMETSAIYGMGALLGHKCLSISTAVANRATKTFSADTDRAVDNMIRQSLQVIADNDL